MANQKITVEVDVQSNTAKETNQAERLGAALKSAAESAQKIKVPAGSASAATGVGAVMQKSQPVGAQAVMQYGQQRGAAGATGAEARDFARQSEGLGGLVRIYATYAANIYAAAAAFNALSRAMDTENMVKGLDQLGATTGTSLGGLSKDLVKATDGAISLRDAMSATVKVTSAGFDSETVLRLGNVAKKASQALGVDMGDAISRLSRGITKLEPELLDELGIFTKLDKSTEDYAKSIGKSVAQLTDFEKRSAFANAVLTEGEKKFKSIKIDANPYTKLLASLQDLSTEGLKLVNTVLGPIVGYLATSPTALTSIIALLGVQLAKTTVPKLLEVKQAFDSLSASSAKVATGKKNEAIKALLPEITEIRNAANASVEAYYNTLESSQAKALSLAKGSTKKKLSDIFGRGEEATAQDLTYIESLKKKAGANSELTKALNEYSASLTGIIAKESIYAEASKKSKEIIAQQYNLTKAVGQLQIIASNELQNARSKEIISNTAAITSTQGISAGLKDLWVNTIKAAKEQKVLTDTIEITTANGKTFTQSIDTIVPKMGLLKTISTLTVGSFAALATAASTLGKALLTFLPYIGLAVAAFEAFNYLFSTNEKQQKVFQDAVDKSEQSVDNLKRTFDVIADKPFSEKFSTESLTASANAINEMNIATAGLAKGIIDLNKNASGWDKFIDGFKIMFGGGARKEFAENVTKTVTGALDAAYGSPQATSARKKIANILQIDPDFTAKQFEEAISGAANNEDKLKALTATMKALGVELQATASKSKDFDTAMTVSGKAYSDFTNQFALKDPLTLLALSFSDSGAKLAAVLQEPEQAIQKLFEISKDANKIKLFDSEDQANLRSYAKDLETVNANYAQQKEALTEANKELDKQNALLDEQRKKVLAKSGRKDLSNELLDTQVSSDVLKAVQNAAEQQKTKQAAFAVAQQQAKDLVDKFPNISYNQIVKGSEVLSASIGIAFSKVGTALGNAAVSVLGDLPGTARLQEQTANRQIDAQIKLQRATLDLLTATTISTQQQKVSDAKKALSDYELQVSLQKAAQMIATGTATGPTDYDTKKASLQEKITSSEQFLRAYETGNSQKALAAAKDIAKTHQGDNEVMAQVAELQKFIAQSAGIQAAIAEGMDQKAANALNRRVKEYGEENKLRQDALDKNIAINNEELQILSRVEKQAGFLTSTQIAEEGRLQSNILINQQTKERFDLETKITALKDAQRTIDFDKNGKPTGAAGAAGRAQGIAALEDTLKNRLPDKFAAQASEQKFQSQQKLNAQVEKEQAFKVKIKALDVERFNILDDTAQQIREINLATQSAVLPLSPQYMAEQEAYVKSRKDQLMTEREINKLTTDYNTNQGKLTREKSNLGQSPEFAARRAEIDQELAADKAVFDAKISQINAISALTKESDSQKLAYNLKQLDFAERLDKVTDSVKGLGDAFGQFGSSLATAVTTVTEFNIAQEKSADKLASLREQIAEQKDAGVVNPALLKEESKLTEKARKDEISGYAKMAGAAKNMFKEKTGAYRAFAGVEKALTTYRLLMDAQKIASELGVTAAAVAGSATRAAAAVPEAVSNATVGITAQAKGDPYTAWPRIAAMSALMAGVLAAIGGSIGGGGGTKSFTPTAAQRQETQGTAMGYDAGGKQVQVREGVFGDTSAKSESIANSLKIMKNNSVSGLSYNDKMLKSLEKLNESMKAVAKSVYNISGIRTGSGFNTQEGTTASGGFFGIGGKSVSKEITDAGIQLKGTFLELAKGTGGVINQFETLTTTTTKKGFFGIGGGTSTSVTTQTKDLDPKAQKAIGDALGQGYQTILEAGIQTGLSPQRIDEILSGVKVDEIASLRGLKGEELQTQLNAVVGSILDDAAGATFEQFKQFRKFGEGMLETVVRVIDTNKKVKQVLSNLSGSVQDVSFDVSESMVKMAGGLQAFVEQSDSFSENFLTEQERLAPKQKAVRAELDRLGLSWVTTREQFKGVVQSLIESGAAGSQTYADLMKLNKGFAEVTPEIKDLSKSLEDLKNDLKSAAEQRISDLKSARDSFDQFSKSIRDYQQSLKTGALSPLTPGQKYMENKRQFDQLSALAKTDTKEGADARSKLQGAASALLESSRTMYSSSEVYTQDFGDVQTALTDAAQYGDEQVKKANESIELVKQQVKGIVDLKDSVDRLPEPISAGVGSAVTAALASITSPVEAAKVERDERAIALAKEAADKLNAINEAIRTEKNLAVTVAPPAASTAAAQAAPEPVYYSWWDPNQGSVGGVGEGFAKGTNYIPEDMFAQIHKGERIIPAADNRQLMKMMSASSGSGNGELYEEVCRLTKQVEVLTQVVADGANMNTQATERNTVELAKTIEDMSNAAAYGERLINRTTVV